MVEADALVMFAYAVFYRTRMIVQAHTVFVTEGRRIAQIERDGCTVTIFDFGTIVANPLANDFAPGIFLPQIGSVLPLYRMGIIIIQPTAAKFAGQINIMS